MPTLKQLLDAECPNCPAGLVRQSELCQGVEELYFVPGVEWTLHHDLYRPWPGHNDRVFRWFVLENGTAIGITGTIDEPDGVARVPFQKVYHLDWNRLRNCRIVYEAGSFTKAAQIMNITQSAVSRQIGTLEQELGYDIFFRNRQGLLPTEYGEYFLDSIQKMWDSLELGLARLNEMHETPVGALSLTTTEAFGSAWLSSRLGKFHEMHPSIEVSLLLLDNVVLDLCKREADCAIQFSKPEQPNLVFKFIEEFSYHIYGCQEYLKKNGIPRSVEDLNAHQLIVYGDGVGQQPIRELNWLSQFNRASEPDYVPDISINNIYGIYRAAENGLGLAALPFYLSERSSKLVRVLPDVIGPKIPIYFVYPQELGLSQRITLLRDFIVDEIRANWGDLRKRNMA